MKSVLVVEDEENLLNLYITEFQEAGYDVRTACSGRQALESIREKIPDLVVLDILLGDIRGLELLDEIKSINRDMPVIINSAYTVYKSDFASWMADEYVVKSSDVSELIMKARSIVRP